MPSLVLSDVGFAHSDAIPLLSGVGFHLSAGWTGVVGPNGAGKTTLLRLLAGELQPDSGRIRLGPAGATRWLCPQRVEALDATVRQLAANDEGDARRLRARLALEPAQLERWHTLSPGERKRWQLGAALAARPTLLLLDEPTNHLDTAARELLVGALRTHAGIGVLVSHDRELLDVLCTETLRVRTGSVVLWSGSYSTARSAWQRAERQKRDAHALARREERRLRGRLARTRSERDHAEARRRTSKRMKGRGDSSTRGRFKATRRRSAELRLGRQADRLGRQLERAGAHSRGFRFDRKLGRALSVDAEGAPRSILLHLEREQLATGPAPLLRELNLSLARDARIWLRGPNGAGKTTLMRALLDTWRGPADRLLYLPQELETGQERALLDGVRTLDPETRGRALSLLAALGVDPDGLLASAAPSPGEGRKLALADGLARRVHALLLDEPTNHLDIESIERLQEALVAYPGALLLVTHDGALARACTTTAWELVDGRVRTRPV